MPGTVEVLVTILVVLITSALVLFAWRKFQDKGAGFSKRTASAVEEPQVDDREKVTLLFGTQTGTAERFCKQLKTELQQKFGEDTLFRVIDIEEYKHEEQLQNERLVLLTLATYGDGEPTDNTANFFHWVTDAAKEDESKNLLQGVNFGIFGLGNRQYEHFCAVGKKVQAAMLALGANAIIQNGEGDDDEDIDADFDKWREELYDILDDSDLIQKSASTKERGSIEVMVAGSVAAFDVEMHPEIAADSLAANPQWQGDGTSVHSPYPARVLLHKELHTPESERSCLHVELDFTGSQASYEAGDHVGIIPQNEEEVIDRAAACLGLPLDTVFSLHVPPSNPHQLTLPFNGPITLRTALAWHSDLLSPVTKPSLQALAAYASGPDAARLRSLLSPEGQQEYKRWHAQSRNLLEVLEEFKTARPPLGVLFASIVSKLQTRFYSISSSPNVQGSHVHVTCAVVDHAVATGRPHRGITSHQLQRAKAGDRIPAFIRKSTFRLPADPEAPVIMIGPGTGLAPFRGFLQERAYMASQGIKLGTAHLFFGCRNSKHDYIYEAELADLKAQGGYTNLHTAFSREGPRKVYVQHRLEQHQSQLWPMMESGGYVYVCGEAKRMAKDVHKVLSNFASRSPLGIEKFMQQLSESGRYQKDVW